MPALPARRGRILVNTALTARRLLLDACRLLLFVTLFAVEFEAEAGGAALFGEHPFARDERRVVAHVLRVAAVEQGAPVALVVAVVADDAPPHLASISISTRSSSAP